MFYANHKGFVKSFSCCMMNLQPCRFKLCSCFFYSRFLQKKNFHGLKLHSCVHCTSKLCAGKHTLSLEYSVIGIVISTSNIDSSRKIKPILGVLTSSSTGKRSCSSALSKTQWGNCGSPLLNDKGYSCTSRYKGKR
jgi:hypothetical protein